MKTKTLILSLSMLFASFAPSTCHAMSKCPDQDAFLYALVRGSEDVWKAYWQAWEACEKSEISEPTGVFDSIYACPVFCCLLTPIGCLLGYKCYKCFKGYKRKKRKKKRITIEVEKLEPYVDENGETKIRKTRNFNDKCKFE